MLSFLDHESFCFVLFAAPFSLSLSVCCADWSGGYAGVTAVISAADFEATIKLSVFNIANFVCQIVLFPLRSKSLQVFQAGFSLYRSVIVSNLFCIFVESWTKKNCLNAVATLRVAVKLQPARLL